MNTSLDQLTDIIGGMFGTAKADLASARRDRPMVYPRFLFCYVARNTLSMSFAEIGRYLDRDHTSIVHAVQRIDQLMADGEAEYPDPVTIVNDIDRISNALKVRNSAPEYQMHTDLDGFLVEIRQTRPSMRAALMKATVIKIGGMWSAPHAGYGDHEYSVSLFGVSATGPTEDELCLNWFRCALRVLEAQYSMERAS